MLIHRRHREGLLKTESNFPSLIAEPRVAQESSSLVIRLIPVYWLCARRLAWAQVRIGKPHALSETPEP